MQNLWLTEARVESAILTEAYVQLVNEEFALDLGSGLRWGQLTVP